MSRGGVLAIFGLVLLLAVQSAIGSGDKRIFTKGQQLKDLVKQLRQQKQNKREQQFHPHQSEKESLRGRSLKQQTSNIYDACPAQRYIYEGSTQDSIFNQLTVVEFQSAAQFLADANGFILPYGSFTPSTPLTPVAAPEAATTGVTSERSVGTNVTALGPNTENSEGLYDPDNPVLNQNITAEQDYIFNVFLYPLDKQQALAYLDNGGPIPPRYAQAIVVRGSVPDVMEYKIGPLPIGANSTIQKLRADGAIPYNKRPPNDLPEALNLGYWTEYVQAELKDFFLSWLGQCGDDSDPQCANNNITSMNIELPTRELNRYQRVSAIVHFWQAGDGSAYELLNLPFAYKINNTDQDYENWELFEFEICGQGYDSVDDLNYAFQHKKLNLCKPVNWTQPTYNASWADDDMPAQPVRADLAQPGPRVYEPAGKRFTLLQGDNENSRVFQWGDWQAHVSSHPWTGLTFHDIRFKGDRIAYELSLNDQIVAYSGWQTVGQTFYLDSFDQLGASQYTLLPGLDCPETAAYMPVTAMGIYGETFSANESVCMYENYGQTTTWRHFDGITVNGIRDYSFTVRTAMTLGNYDYLVTVGFYLDGSINVQVHMAGYLQALYYDTTQSFSNNEAPYGTRVHTNTIGNIHDHLSSWKVDLDVLGTQNSFHTAAIKVGTYDQVLGPGGTPPWALPTDLMKYQADERVTNEAGYVLDYHVPTIFRFVNEQYNNSWGNARGYLIQHGYTSMQLLPATHPICQAAAWSKYHVAVSVRKEDEPRSGLDYYDSHSPIDPIFSLNNVLNNESIVNQDLVAWVSMGIIHVPRSEDVPLISNLGTDFWLKPVNYFDSLPDLDVVDSNNFQACAADQGAASGFDYSYGGDNTQSFKAGFKYAGPLQSKDIFNTAALSTAPRLAPQPAMSPGVMPGAASAPRPAASAAG